MIFTQALAPILAAAIVTGAAPASGLASVSDVVGTVVIVRGESGAQIPAAVDVPLLAGDSISTADDSRIDVRLDAALRLRITPDTQVRFVSLDPSSREMQLAAGTAELSQTSGSAPYARIDTPSVTVQPNRAGDYRISVLSNGQTLVAVRSGSATVVSASGTQTITPRDDAAAVAVP